MFDVLRAEIGKSFILLRPHPNDFTFGWSKLYFRLKFMGAEVGLSFGNVEQLDFQDIGHIYTYSSNFLRLIPKSYNFKNITAVKNLPDLLDVDTKRYSVYQGVL